MGGATILRARFVAGASARRLSPGEEVRRPSGPWNASLKATACVLGGRNPTGRRLRYVALEGLDPLDPAAPWYEIVGVVRDLGIETPFGRGGVYHPVAWGLDHPTNLIIHLRTDPQEFAPKLRAIASSTDPTLLVSNPMPLPDAAGAEEGVYVWGFAAIASIAFTALMLSLAGIYAVMSFAVSRRTREIGIRTALGARASSLVFGVFRRPLLQIGLGVMFGGILLWGISYYVSGGELTAVHVLLVGADAIMMALVSMLACVVPMRRALRIEPTEALRAEG